MTNRKRRSRSEMALDFLKVLQPSDASASEVERYADLNFEEFHNLADSLIASGLIEWKQVQPSQFPALGADSVLPKFRRVWSLTPKGEHAIAVLTAAYDVLGIQETSAIDYRPVRVG